MRYDDNRYGIYVSIIPYKEFEENRRRLGLTQETYLINLMGKDFTGIDYPRKRIKHVDLQQTKFLGSD